MKTNLIDLLKEYCLIEERDGKFFSQMVMEEEITIELKEIDCKLKIQGD